MVLGIDMEGGGRGGGGGGGRLVFLWRQCDVAFLTTFILQQLPRIYLNLKVWFVYTGPTNILARCVLQNSSLIPAFSAEHVRDIHVALCSLPSIDRVPITYIKQAVPRDLDQAFYCR